MSKHKSTIESQAAVTGARAHAADLTPTDYETVLHNSPIATAIVSRDGNLRYYNSAWVAQGWLDLWTVFSHSFKSQEAGPRAAFIRVLRGEEADGDVTEITLPSGEKRYIRWVLNAWRLTGGHAEGAVLYVRDVTDEVKAQERASDGQAFLAGILNNIDEAVIASDAAGNVKYSNARLRDFQLGAPEGESDLLNSAYFHGFDENCKTPLGKTEYPLYKVMNNERVIKQRLAFKTGENTFKHVEASGQQIMDENGERKGAVISIYEITDRIEKERQLKRSEAEARRIAYSDPMTGFPNRVSLQRTLSQDLQNLCHGDEKLLVLVADIHRFKAINDIHGHKIGDRMLPAVADRLADLPGPRALLGRLARE